MDFRAGWVVSSACFVNSRPKGGLVLKKGRGSGDDAHGCMDACIHPHEDANSSSFPSEPLNDLGSTNKA